MNLIATVTWPSWMDGLATERKFVPQIAIGNISDNGVWSGGGIMEYGLRHVPLFKKLYQYLDLAMVL